MSLNLQEILDQANFILNKDQQGDTVKPEAYQILLKVISQEFFNIELDKLVQLAANENQKIDAYIIMDSALYKFKKILNKFELSDEFVIDLPTDYKKYIALSVQLDGQMFACDILEEGDFNKRISSLVGDSLALNPVATIIGTLIRPIPNDFTGIKLSYFRKPLVPFYDYCINEADEVVFMPENSHIISEAGIGVLRDFNGGLIESNVTHLDEPTLPYTSQTVEFEYDERFIPMIINLLVEKMGARSREILIADKSKS